jgi:hypothetical protein
MKTSKLAWRCTELSVYSCSIIKAVFAYSNVQCAKSHFLAIGQIHVALILYTIHRKWSRPMNWVYAATTATETYSIRRASCCTKEIGTRIGYSKRKGFYFIFHFFLILLDWVGRLSVFDAHIVPSAFLWRLG